MVKTRGTKKKGAARKRANRTAAQRVAFEGALLTLLWDGLTLKEIAARLGYTYHYTSLYVRQMVRAAAVSTHVGLVRRALEAGLIRVA